MMCFANILRIYIHTISQVLFHGFNIAFSGHLMVFSLKKNL